MDAPRPVMNTPGNNIKMIEKESFMIKINETQYKFDLSKADNNEIFLKISEDSILSDKYYTLNLNVSEFHALNIFCSIYKNIDEIYNFLLEIFNSKNYSTILKDNKIIIVIEYPILGGKKIDIKLKLAKIELSKKDVDEKLFKAVKELLEENAKIKKENEEKNEKINIIMNELRNKNEEIDKIKKELNNVKNENIEFKNRIKNIEEYIENKKKQKEEKKKRFDLDNSYIIQDKEEINKIREWISVEGEIKSIKLLYRATEDGDTCEIFYQKCGNKGPTISFIKTENGRRFGGFSKVEWINNQGDLKQTDNTAFLFSLDNMKKYDILKPENAIFCLPTLCCLVYGNNGDGKGIFLYSGFLNKKSYEDLSSKIYDISSNDSLSGENEYVVDEVEVYQIIFN